MPTYRIEGTKGDHHIAEQAHSLTKAQWVAAAYVEHGYKVEIKSKTSIKILLFLFKFQFNYLVICSWIASVLASEKRLSKAHPK